MVGSRQSPLFGPVLVCQVGAERPLCVQADDYRVAFQQVGHLSRGVGHFLAVGLYLGRRFGNHHDIVDDDTGIEDPMRSVAAMPFVVSEYSNDVSVCAVAEI